MKADNRVCSRCVMDSSALGIVFDDKGVCSYCRNFEESLKNKIIADESIRNNKLLNFIEKIKEEGVGKPYDCIIGVSGGVDSSWVLVKAIEFGLRPLAVHMDNGWNSELAQSNIENLVQGLGVDLETYVVEWAEYRDLMNAFFSADVIDVELLYDNAMLAVNYKMAKKYGVRFILSGSNQASEGMLVPRNWNWFKYDKKNINNIAKKYGVKISSLPTMGVFDYLYYEFVKKIRWTSILDLLDYSKFEAMGILQEKYSYKPYPYKHYESVFTRFYQGYILPKKFGVDKRKLHHSSLIISGQMQRENAVSDLTGNPYPSDADLQQDRLYFLKKMGWADKDLDDYIKRGEVSHAEYGSEINRWDFLKSVHNRFLRERSSY